MSETIGSVKAPDSPPPHPGPFRMMKVGPGIAGILIALGFIVLGIVGLPLARWFLLGAVLSGCLIALVLHLIRD